MFSLPFWMPLSHVCLPSPKKRGGVDPLVSTPMPFESKIHVDSISINVRLNQNKM